MDNSNEYVEDLQDKIRVQARRLYEMQNYIDKCEKQISELKTIKGQSTIQSNKRSNFVESRMVEDIARLKYQLHSKEKENNKLQERLSFLQETLNVNSEIEHSLNEDANNKDIHELRHELTTVSKQLGLLRKERNKLFKNNKELQILQKKTEEQNKSLKNALHSNLLNYDLDKVVKGTKGHKLKREELVSAFTEITDLVRDKEELAKDNAYSNELVEQLRQTVDELTAKNQRLMEEKGGVDEVIAGLKGKLEQTEKARNDMQFQIDTLSAENSQLGLDLRMRTESCARLTEERKSKDSELFKIRESAMKEAEEKGDEFSRSIERLKEVNLNQDESWFLSR